MLGQTESIRTQDLTQDPLVTDGGWATPIRKERLQDATGSKQLHKFHPYGGSSGDDPQVTIGFNLFQY